MIRQRVTEFAVTLLGHCLLLSAAKASRSTAPSVKEAAPASLADLLWPQLLLDVATGQLLAFSAIGVMDAAEISALAAAPNGAGHEQHAVSIGGALTALAALCLLPEAGNLQKPAGADDQLVLAMQGAEVGRHAWRNCTCNITWSAFTSPILLSECRCKCHVHLV